MTYNPRKYWRERLAREGISYVAFQGKNNIFNHQLRIFGDYLKVVLNEIEEPETILDFGCGVGRFAEFLGGFCKSYYGVDINEGAIPRHEDEKYKFIFLSSDEIPLVDDSIDCVASVTVLQHIVSDKDWDIWTQELKRVLKPGGDYLLIDNVVLPNPAPHMNPRGPDAIADALGAKIATKRLVSAESKNALRSPIHRR